METYSSQDSKPLSSCIMLGLLLGLESPLSPKPGPLVLSTLTFCPMPSLLFYSVFWNFYHPLSLLFLAFMMVVALCSPTFELSHRVLYVSQSTIMSYRHSWV